MEKRNIKLVRELSADCPAVVRITTIKGRKSLAKDYFVSPLATDFGVCYRMEKVLNDDEEPIYNVNIKQGEQSCECIGYLAHGKCKHVSGLATLRERKLI